MIDKKKEDFVDHLAAWLDDPQSEANHMVLGLSLDQKREARGKQGKKSLATWV